MNVKKPYLLFHGYKRFENKIKPSPDRPLWTADFRQAQDYMGTAGSQTAGFLMMCINVQQLKILDINDIAAMTDIYGGLGKIISNETGFYMFVDMLDSYFMAHSENSWLKDFIEDFGIRDELSIKILLKTYKLWTYEHGASDAYSAQIFMPMAANAGYNCIVEHEEREFDGQYVLLSDAMLKGKCCRFVSHDEFMKYSDAEIDALNGLNIYSQASISQAFKILNKRR